MKRPLLLALICVLVSATSMGSGSIRRRTEVNLKLLEQALNDFHLDMKRFPGEAEGLSILLREPNGAQSANWRGPYVMSSRNLKDHWANSFVYHCPSRYERQAPFDLYSLGKDGRSASDGHDSDDINVWESAQREPSPTFMPPVAGYALCYVLACAVCVSAFFAFPSRKRVA